MCRTLKEVDLESRIACRSQQDGVGKTVTLQAYPPMGYNSQQYDYGVGRIVAIIGEPSYILQQSTTWCS